MTSKFHAKNHRSSEHGEYFNTDHLKKELKKKAVRGAGATVFSRASVYFIQMLSTILLARMLSPDDFGLIAMVAVFTNILVEFGMLRLTEATIQQEHITHQQVSTLLWINVFLCVVIMIVLIAAAPVVAWIYDEPRLIDITRVMAVAFVFSGIATQHLALLKRSMQFYRITIIEITASLISFGAAIGFALNGWGYWTLVMRKLLFSFMTAVCAWILCTWRPGLPRWSADIIPLLQFGLHSLGNYLMTYFNRSFDKFLIGWRYSALLLGFYEKAYSLFVMPVNQLSYPLTSVAVATLSRLVPDPDKYKRYYLKAVSLLAFIGMPLSALFALIGKDLMILLLGQQWEKAGSIFSIFSLGVGVFLVYVTHGWLHLSLGKAGRWFKWGMIAFGITALLMVIGLAFGASGVASAYTLSFFLLLFPSIVYAGKPIQLGWFRVFNVIWRQSAAALFSGLLCWYCFYHISFFSSIYENFSSVIRILTAVILCSSIYVVMIILLYQSVEPIKQCIELIITMVPEKIVRKKKVKEF